MSYIDFLNNAVPAGGTFLVLMTLGLAVISIVNLASDSNSRKILNISRMIGFILLFIQSTFVYFPIPESYQANINLWQSTIIFAKMAVVALAYVAFAVYLVLEMQYLGKKHKH